MTMKHFIVIQNKVKQKKTTQMMKQLKTFGTIKGLKYILAIMTEDTIRNLQEKKHT